MIALKDIEPVTVPHLIRIEKIYTAFTRVRNGNFNFPGELHDFWEMVYIDQGVASFTADDRLFECGAGTLVFHKPNEFHRIWNADKNRVVFSVITFSAEGEYCYRLTDKVIVPDEYCQLLIRELQRQIAEGEPDEKNYSFKKLRSDPAYAAQFCSTLELLLYRCALEDCRSDAPLNDPQSLYIRAVKCMRENIDRALKVQDLADRLNVSVSQLKRVFKKYALMGVHDYYLTLRIETSKELLLHGASVCDTAQRTGFDSQNHFSSVFKKRVGMSPLRFTKSRES